MKPFKKMWGWIGAIGALGAGAALAKKTGDFTVLVPALGAILALFSHSATGTGGTAENP